jgi:hypothetical protein
VRAACRDLAQRVPLLQDGDHRGCVCHGLYGSMDCSSRRNCLSGGFSLWGRRFYVRVEPLTGGFWTGSTGVVTVGRERMKDIGVHLGRPNGRNPRGAACWVSLGSDVGLVAIARLVHRWMLDAHPLGFQSPYICIHTRFVHDLNYIASFYLVQPSEHTHMIYLFHLCSCC